MKDGAGVASQRPGRGGGRGGGGGGDGPSRDDISERSEEATFFD